MDFVPYNTIKLLPKPNQVVQLDISIHNLREGENYAFFDTSPTLSPRCLGTLNSALSTGDLTDNPRCLQRVSSNTQISESRNKTVP